MKHITKRLYIHRIDWTGEPPTYEVREPGQGTHDDYEPGATLAVFNTKAEAQAFVPQQTTNTTMNTQQLVRQSHHPDLTQRLIEAHQTLQMSREYLEGLYPQGHNATHNIAAAMRELETAIDTL